MRSCSISTLVITLFLAGSGKLNAQTAEMHQKVETKLALKRLERGIRIAESIKVLAKVPLQESVRHLQKAELFLRRLSDRLPIPSDENISDEALRKLSENSHRLEQARRGQIEVPDRVHPL